MEQSPAPTDSLPQNPHFHSDYFGIEAVEANSRLAEIVSTGELGRAPTPMPDQGADPVLEQVARPVAGMNHLQISRTRGVMVRSMQYALNHLQNELDDPTLVHTPDPNHFDHFWDKDAYFYKAGLLRNEIYINADGGKGVKFHPHFEQFRDRSTCVWAVKYSSSWHDEDQGPDVNSHWCLIVANFVNRQSTIISPEQSCPWMEEDGDVTFFASDRCFDRSLFDVQIFDPLWDTEADRDFRRMKLVHYFNQILELAGVAARPTQFVEHMPAYEQVQYKWQTGYQVYVIAREYMRRLNVLHTFRHIGAGLEDINVWIKVMWGDYFGLMGIDAARESMMAGCAVRAIQKSKFRARLAIELPGDLTYTDPRDLDPTKSEDAFAPGANTREQEDEEEFQTSWLWSPRPWLLGRGL
ncbi:hypothetical protein TruAng_007447 [Truncatella angustata]|nr:hypothetical protein TruAng_007447 [Truncatella angustata]